VVARKETYKHINTVKSNKRKNKEENYSAQRLDLFAWCVRLSRPLVGFRTHFKSLHFHSFIHSVLRTRSRLCDRAFASAKPQLWNNLPVHIRRPNLTLGQPCSTGRWRRILFVWVSGA